MNGAQEDLRLALDRVRDALQPFVEREMARVHGTSWRDAMQPRTAGRLSVQSPLDLYALLGLIAVQHWHDTFRDRLSPSARSYCHELLAARNRDAHRTPESLFSVSDTIRVLDTASRILRDPAIGAEQSAAEIDRMRGRFLGSHSVASPGIPAAASSNSASRLPRDRTHAAHILDYLRGHPEGASDSQLVQALDSQPSHATVNIVCRQLEGRGFLKRVGPRGSIRNFLAAGGAEHSPVSENLTGSALLSPTAGTTPRLVSRPWYWEGNVQGALASALVERGWSIKRVADTASRERGKDIEAQRGGAVLWTTVKGFPEALDRTSAGAQARVWFAGALLDAALWRDESRDALVLVGMPAMTTYRNLAARVTTFEGALAVSFAWVFEDGSVELPSLEAPNHLVRVAPERGAAREERPTTRTQPGSPADWHAAQGPA